MSGALHYYTPLTYAMWNWLLPERFAVLRVSAESRGHRWYALLAPAGTPVAIVARLNADLNALLADATIREFLAKQGFSPAGGTPEALTNQFRTELERWLRIADEAKIKVD